MWQLFCTRCRDNGTADSRGGKEHILPVKTGCRTQGRRLALHI